MYHVMYVRLNQLLKHTYVWDRVVALTIGMVRFGARDSSSDTTKASLIGSGLASYSIARGLFRSDVLVDGERIQSDCAESLAGFAD